MISCDDTLADRRATSNEEEGRANDDWKVLGFQSWLGGGASAAVGESPAVRSGASGWEAPQSLIVVSVSKQVQRVGKEDFW